MQKWARGRLLLRCALFGLCSCVIAVYGFMVFQAFVLANVIDESRVVYPPSFHPSYALVMGMWNVDVGRMSLQDLERFSRTLRATGSNASIGVFIPTSNGEQNLRDCTTLLSRYEASAILYSESFATTVGLYKFSAVRFTLAYLTVQRFSQLEYVMVSDLKDVAFQFDPFVYAAQVLDRRRHQTLIVALESNLTSFTPGTINSFWVGACFGEEAVGRLFGQRVSCSGTTLGFGSAMYKYLQAMDENSRRHFRCCAQGTDQGVHNYLIHSKGFAQQVRTETAETGRILTADRSEWYRFEDETGLLVNELGHPYVILHQFNRCAQQAKGFLSATRKEILEARQAGRAPAFTPTDRFSCKDVENPVSLSTLPF